MKKAEIKALNNQELIAELYWTAVRTTNEVNSRRGLTKKQHQKEEWVLQEVAERFGLDFEFLKGKIDLD